MKKNLFLVLILVLSLCCAVSCSNKKETHPIQTATPEVVKTEVVKAEVVKPVETAPVAPVESVPVNETVVVKEVQTEMPAPIEPVKVEESAKVAEPVFEPYVLNFTYGNNSAKGVFNEDSATVTFSGDVKAEDISFILGKVVSENPGLLKSGVTYSVSGSPLTLSLSYPKGSSQEDLQYIISLVSEEINKAEETAKAAAEAVKKAAEEAARKAAEEKAAAEAAAKAAAEAAKKAAEEAARKAAEEKVAAEAAARAAAEAVKKAAEEAARKAAEEKAAAEAAAKAAAEAAKKAAEEAARKVAEEKVAAEAAAKAATEAAAKAAEEAAKNAYFGTNSFRAVFNAANFMKDYEQEYSLGLEVQYEYRMRDSFAVTATGIYNRYFDKSCSKYVVSDRAVIIDVLAYSRVSDHTLVYSGVGGGINFFREGSEQNTSLVYRFLLGAEVQLTDHLALNYGAAVQLTSNDKIDKAVFQPARIGVSFYF